MMMEQLLYITHHKNRIVISPRVPLYYDDSFDNINILLAAQYLQYASHPLNSVSRPIIVFFTLANFNAIVSATYSVVKDSPGTLPPNLLSTCGNIGAVTSTGNVTVQADATGIVSSSIVSAQCGNDSVCIIPFGTTLQVDTSLNLGALIVRGIVEWNDSTQSSDSIFLCAGYAVVEGLGKWDMDLQNNDAVIYVKDNLFEHHHLRSRAFGR